MLIRLFKKNWPLILSALILAGLLFKNPFSTRTLIPNLEPFPDTFHYLSPPRCLLSGQGFKMCLPGRDGKIPSVPPAYSIFLIPFFFISADPRMFYFLNIFLSFLSLGLLYKIFQKITKHQFLIGLGLLVYVTTYLTYWFPTLAMAENLLIPAFLTGIYLLVLPVNRRRAVLAGIFGALMYGSKHAALGSTVSFGLLYLLKILTIKRSVQNCSSKEKLTLTGLFVSFIGSLYLLFGGFNSLVTIFNFFKAFFVTVQTTQNGVEVTKTTHSWFSDPKYILPNLSFYSSFITGQPLRVLWDVRPLMTPVVSWFGALGLVVNLFFKKHRFLAVSLILMIITSLIPILPFYVGDGRYGIVLFPILILGLVLGLDLLISEIKESFKIKPIYLNLFLVLLTGIYLSTKAITLKNQLVLNLKYAEQPWWYLSVQEFNQYFAQHDFEKAPYLITLHSPYYLDYFGNSQYQPLPLSNQQDFHGDRLAIWGIPQDQPLLEFYRSKLEAGHPVYLTNYGVNATSAFSQAEKAIHDRFETELIAEGCHQLCNLYQLSLTQEKK